VQASAVPKDVLLYHIEPSLLWSVVCKGWTVGQNTDSLSHGGAQEWKLLLQAAPFWVLVPKYVPCGNSTLNIGVDTKLFLVLCRVITILTIEVAYLLLMCL
jgi:hypothetical protein